jgi:hypothetical protein
VHTGVPIEKCETKGDRSHYDPLHAEAGEETMHACMFSKGRREERKEVRTKMTEQREIQTEKKPSSPACEEGKDLAWSRILRRAIPVLVRRARNNCVPVNECRPVRIHGTC